MTTYESDVLNLGGVQEIRNAIDYFNSKGKLSVMYMKDSFTSADSLLLPYYLASAYSAIITPAKSFLDLSPPIYETEFFSNVLDKLGIKVHVEKRKDYKTAFNNLSENSFTNQHREELSKIDGSIMSQIKNGILAQRKIDRESLEEIINNGYISTEDAKAKKLVDHLLPYPHIDDFLSSHLRIDDGKEIHEMDDLVVVRLETYILFKKLKSIWADFGKQRDKIAVVELNNMSSKVLQGLKERDDVKAVVFRVDSPGGAYSYFQELSEDVAELRKKKKVIASFGNVAASGGYLAACYADKIIANPGTITGSIGVISMIPNAQELLSKIGVTFDSIHKDKGVHLSFSRPMSDKEKKSLGYITDTLYQWFKESVSEGRNMPIEKVEEVAQGKVWTGEQALEIGLVDHLGGLTDAIELAKKEADVPNATYFYPSPLPMEIVYQISYNAKTYLRILTQVASVFKATEASIEVKSPNIKIK